MTREEAIEVIRKEYACVDADCDIERNCGRCELHMPSKEPILKAYEMAIQALSQEPTEKPMTVDEMEREYEKSKALFHKIVECDDAISRKAVEEITWEEPSYTDALNVLSEVRDKVRALPPVTQKSGKWIPVSERLPEDRRAVLVTAYWHETYQVMMASYYGDGLWWCVPFNNCGEHMQKLKPKAWMPLPKPYEPQERSE